MQRNFGQLRQWQSGQFQELEGLGSSPRLPTEEEEKEKRNASIRVGQNSYALLLLAAREVLLQLRKLQGCERPMGSLQQALAQMPQATAQVDQLKIIFSLSLMAKHSVLVRGSRGSSP